VLVGAAFQAVSMLSEATRLTLVQVSTHSSNSAAAHKQGYLSTAGLCQKLSKEGGLWVALLCCRACALPYTADGSWLEAY
jgi:hypothetical protein